jgi:large subunit ribosomal protein L17
MYRKMGMREDQRRAALRNMTTSLLKEERIKTTATRASEVSAWLII